MSPIRVRILISTDIYCTFFLPISAAPQLRRQLSSDEESKNTEWEMETYEVLRDEVDDEAEEVKGEEDEGGETYIPKRTKLMSRRRRQLQVNEYARTDAERNSDILSLDVTGFYVEDVISTNANSVGINYTISFIIQKYGFSSKYGF